jgi:hypothetical protein
MIPIIRGLAGLNPNVSQAIDNIVSLANCGHKVFFDRKVPTEQVDLMRNHLENKRKDWAPGVAGIDGLVNKLFYQLLISGAISAEWVPNNTLTGIESCILLDPENIAFKLNERQTKYEPYQIVKNALNVPNIDNLIKLNTNSYQYLAMNGDGESPYGIPPYLPVIGAVKTQNRMNGNINFIVDTMGLIGFLEVFIEKPAQTGALAPIGKYEQELQGLLKKAKDQVIGGLRDGVVVGFKDDHEFNFNSASKNFESVTKLYQENELQFFSALKTDGALMGRGYSTSETQINVVFMKMLSQLRNHQNIVKTVLEFGYRLELMLAGFKFDFLKVTFNRSTLQDDLKFQQAEEYKIKNVTSKFILGVIDQEQMADELGYEVSAADVPRVALEIIAGSKPEKPVNADGTPSGGTKRTGQKKTSDRKSKAKKKAVTKD